MAEAARKINYPYFDTTSANDAEFYELKPGKRKVVSLDEKRIAKTSSQGRKSKSSSYASNTKNSASQADSDRVGYLRDRYGIDVQPDQLSPYNQEKNPNQSKNAVAAYPLVQEPVQKGYQRYVQGRPKRVLIKKESEDSSSGVIKKTGGVFTGFMLTGIAMLFFKVHFFFALFSTAVFAAIGTAASIVSRLPNPVTDFIASVSSTAATILGLSSYIDNMLGMFFALYIIHLVYGMVVVGVIAMIAKMRFANPFGGGGYIFKTILAISVVIMHMIPVVNLFVIFPLLAWIWLIALTR